jgi:hypothetical protein
MKRLAIPALLGFGVVLAWVIGQRMSTDAMAVVIGVAVGVAASVPTSVLLVALLRRERREWQPEPQAQMPRAQAYPQVQAPNVIVLNPAELWGQRGSQPYMPLPPAGLAQEGGLRRLRVIGDDDEWNAREG